MTRNAAQCIPRIGQRLALGVLLVLVSDPQPARGQVVDLRRTQVPVCRIEEDLRLGSANGPDDAFVFPCVGHVGDDGLIYGE